MQESIKWRERFISKVSVRHRSECWPWIAGKNADGYGRFRADGKKKQAHHVAFFLWRGRWPTYVLHSCDNPACCNPEHLREGTHQENVAECWRKGRGRAGKNYDRLDTIRRMISDGARNRDICAATGAKNDAVSRIRHGLLYSRPRAE